MSDNQGQVLLKDKDFVDVVDEDGNDLGYQVPKHWDSDQLAPGAKKKSGRGSSSGKSSGGSKPADQEPAKNGSTEDWVAYAKSVKSAQDADLLDEKGEPLTRDALVEKFGTPAS